jgi:cobalt-zinc-cadmium efflux system membrane fusion protein
MKSRHLLIACLVGTALLAGCSRSEQAAPAGHGAAAGDFERGPHRGRLLRDGDFALELQIFEDGVPPEYHVYLFRDDKPLPPDAARVTVELARLGGKVDRFEFAPSGDFLLGNGVVTEPHSFSVVVTADENGRQHRWAFDSFEGRTTIQAKIAQEAGLKTETAGPATVADTLGLNGRIVPNAERVRAVSARFPGPIKGVARSIGDRVKAGDTLATVESNESLQEYAVTAPIAGVVVERHANPGETAGAGPLFVIADYAQVWAELSLFPRDLARVRAGQAVKVKAVDGDLEAEARIVRVAPAEGLAHGSAGSVYVARAVIDNAQRRWAPGMFVNGQVRVGEAKVPLAVKRSALQGFRDFTVVFEQIGETYEVRMLELGRQDDTWVEVLGGIEAGATYVTGNSYLIKADIEKSGASHDH